MILTKIYSGKEIYLDTNDIRAQWIEKQKGTQPEKVSLLRKICKKEKITNLYDLGANYGEFSVGLSDVVSKVYSFEPNPMPYTCLEQTSKLYNNVNVFNKAVSTNDDNQVFHFNTRYSGGGRLSKKWSWGDHRYIRYNSEEYFQEQSVECVDFLSFLSETNGKEKCMIKIDIEGMELEIINHIKSYLDSLDKWFLYFESDKVDYRGSDLPGKVIIEQSHDCLIGVI
jgi:FkbM family methyltransferase|tara:strand:+ start:11790 stop:12467 length:678 start_codon:yes stop_codon:yes gene_type:complete